MGRMFVSVLGLSPAMHKPHSVCHIQLNEKRKGHTGVADWWVDAHLNCYIELCLKNSEVEKVSD